MDLSEPRQIEVRFEDGVLTCMGTLEAGPDAQFDRADEEGVYELASEILVTVLSGELVTDEGVTPLTPGEYVVNDNGLFMRIDGSAATG